jgi:biopolymer transport protein ExbD
MSTVAVVHKVLQKRGLVRISYQSERYKQSPLVLPDKDLKSKIDKIPSKNILHVYVKPDRLVILDGEQVKGEQLIDGIKKRLHVNPNIIVKMSTHQKVTYQDYLDVLEQVKTAGATRIAVHIETNDP